MPLILELLAVWAIAAAAALVYQIVKGRRAAVVAHYAAIFGLFAVLVYFLGAVATDILNLRPDPPSAS